MTTITLETDEECRVIAPNFGDGRLLSFSHDGREITLHFKAGGGETYRFTLHRVERLYYQTLTSNGLLENLYVGAIDQVFTANEPLSLRLAEILSPSSDQHIGEAKGLVLYASPLIDCECAVHFASLTIEALPPESQE